jgi:hypothetical protein
VSRFCLGCQMDKVDCLEKNRIIPFLYGAGSGANGSSSATVQTPVQGHQITGEWPGHVLRPLCKEPPPPPPPPLQLALGSDQPYPNPPRNGSSRASRAAAPLTSCHRGHELPSSSVSLTNAPLPRRRPTTTRRCLVGLPPPTITRRCLVGLQSPHPPPEPRLPCSVSNGRRLAETSEQAKRIRTSDPWQRQHGGERMQKRLLPHARPEKAG